MAERLGRSLSAALESVRPRDRRRRSVRARRRRSTARPKGCGRCCSIGTRPGGQAGSSSRIENYLGFPAGVSGSELTRRAVTQAQRLGAEMLVPLEVTGVSIDAGYKHLTLSDGREIVTRTLLAATGMEYREHPAPGVAALTGAGVYYGAATTEAPAFGDRRVLVVGGGNSAGQAAMYLSRYAKDVQIVVRRDSLRDTMSQYLIEQIEKTPNIRLRTRTELERVEGNGHVERVALQADGGASRGSRTSTRCSSSSAPSREATGCRPRCCATPRGSSSPAGICRRTRRYARIWKERREPMALETSAPGVFAAGDIRAGAMNRVASAVGEGSMVVRFVSRLPGADLIWFPACPASERDTQRQHRAVQRLRQMHVLCADRTVYPHIHPAPDPRRATGD